MKPSAVRHQTWREATLGSSAGCGDFLLLSAPDVDETQGRARVRRAGTVGFPKVFAAVASRIGAATPVRLITPIALLAQPSRIERSRGTVLPFGWRVARRAPRLPRLSEILRRETTRRDTLEPFRVNPCFSEPSGETHRQRLSCASRFDVQRSERNNGTALYQSGILLKASGDHQHECG